VADITVLAIGNFAVELRPVRVGMKSGSHRYRGEKGLRVLFSELGCVLGLGLRSGLHVSRLAS